MNEEPLLAAGQETGCERGTFCWQPVRRPAANEETLLAAGQETGCERDEISEGSRSHMSVAYLPYPLHGGFIHDWLVAGPLSLPIADREGVGDDQEALAILRSLYDPLPGVADLPVLRGDLVVGEAKLRWEHVRCSDDHFVDLSAVHPTPRYLRAWAYVQIECPTRQEARCVLTTHGPADVWIDNTATGAGFRHLHRQEHTCSQLPLSVSFAATLEEGRNALLARFEVVAWRERPFALALRWIGLPEAARVLLPTTNPRVERYQNLEQAFAAAYLGRDLYSREDTVVVRWTDDCSQEVSLAAQVQDLSGAVYGETWGVSRPGAAFNVIRALHLRNGAYRLRLMPMPREFYEGAMRVWRDLPFDVLNAEYHSEPELGYGALRQEVLEEAALRSAGVGGELAKMELGQWTKLRPATVAETIADIQASPDGYTPDLVGLLGALQRHGAHPAFPAEWRQAIEACALEGVYGDDGVDRLSGEAHDLLRAVAAVLAGQLFPERAFSRARQTGAGLRAQGERRALAWLERAGRYGLMPWDSPGDYEASVVALTHLADLATDARLRQRATAVLDKLLFTLALHSLRGVFGSTHGRARTADIKGGRRAATAAISKLLWGEGVFNDRLLGAISLACAPSYTLPLAIVATALDRPEELWARERHGAPPAAPGEEAQAVHKVTYKTPDFMLCSALDYRPGAAGSQEHIWQATFDADAVIFVTHPVCVSEGEAHRPGFWLGNGVLPRVAQWRDLLIAVHRLPDDDWLGFTHAYFPVAAFDEHIVREGWAFARKGDGYLALTAAQGLTLVTRGDSAYRELRSYGRRNVWVCQMGRAAVDGSFAGFQEGVLARAPVFEGLTARCTTRRGEMVTFGWEGPLLVDGRAQALDGFPHYDNPYCRVDWPAERMEIRCREHQVTLQFA